MAISDVVMAVTVAAELTGTTLSGAAVAVMAKDLSAWPEAVVMAALTRCRRELTGRLTLAAVIERLGQADGRPTADEAWAIALDARDEALTVVWNDEICQAFAIARPVLGAGDKIGARMAFRDAYERLVRQGREAGRVPAWRASLGWDKAQRQDVLQAAAQAGLLAAPTVAALLPHTAGGVIEHLLLGGPAPAGGVEDVAGKTRQWVSRLKLAMMLAETRRDESLRDKTEAARLDLAERKRQVAALVSGGVAA